MSNKTAPQPIAFLLQRALTRRDMDRLGFHQLLRQGRPVKVIDVGQIVFPMIADDRQAYEEFRSNGIDIIVVNEPGEISAITTILNQCLIAICDVGSGYLTPTNLRILRALSRSLVRWGMIMANPSAAVTPVPGLSEASPITKSRARNWRHKLTHELANTIFSRLPTRALGVRHADFAVFSGISSMVDRQLLGPATKPILAHSQDYQAFLDDRNTSVTSEPIAVYLDQAFGYHPDTLERKLGTAVTPDYFYPRLSHFFDRIEKELGLRVVIAAHPRLPRDIVRLVYGNREVVFGGTLSLIKRSRLVINSFSTAVSWAVLARKPVLSIGSEELLSHPLLLNVVNRAAAWLDQSPLLIDDPSSVSLNGIPQINDEIYNRFIGEFLKHPQSKYDNIWSAIINMNADN